MLYELPVTNVRLLACPENWQRMTPTAQGRHCAACNREVLDFTAATPADVARARAASADGRVCGRFRPAQVAASVTLRRGQRWFLAAAVLILLQGLSACELQERMPPESPAPEALAAQQAADTAAGPNVWADAGIVGMVAERMPEFAGGQDALMRYLQSQLHYPESLLHDPQAQGKVFVSFVVLPSGRVDSVVVVKGVHPLLNAEAARVVRQMPAWQNTGAKEWRYTLPITFSNQAAPTARP
ncbi:energy transducer TonB [Hymenobacter sp. 15J16-1T3B]|uniref:TonB family protein n=1 Tax=Hymenobacter sp. 15J16-1T3B TaxID=2886941 RepID=UPI001D12DB93|nr:TonB family protein [Hymenobacter sp. 15J16-1T3B]MCC3156334.1 energy transducer TonB [Hymenobacter sp. 15J16-1T3B]